MKIIIYFLMAFVVFAVLAGAEQGEEPESDRSLTTYVINAVLPQDMIERIEGRSFVNGTSIDQELEQTYIYYYTDYTPERLAKIENGLQMLNRRYNALELPFYVVDENQEYYECNIGEGNALVCEFI